VVRSRVIEVKIVKEGWDWKAFVDKRNSASSSNRSDIMNCVARTLSGHLGLMDPKRPFMVPESLRVRVKEDIIDARA
jgi:hypothetical protein